MLHSSGMAVLICKNTSLEGPGTMEEFLLSMGIPFTVVDLSRGEGLPDCSSYDTLVMMGGPMSVNEDDIYPYIREEERLVREFVSQDRRVLGVCLGAQIMAKALGARVYRGPEKEVGWHDIELTGQGIRDRAMVRLATHPGAGDLWRRFRVFHWHGETFDIPEGAVRLACSELYPNQAFRYGSRAYAFQFHIEVSREMVCDWLKDEGLDMERLREETERLYPVYRERAFQFYKAFFAAQPARAQGGEI